jgi:hypothetical protein
VIHFVGRPVLKINSGRVGVGWLEGELGEASFGMFAPRRAGPPLAAKTGRSKIKKLRVTETANKKNEEPHDEPVERQPRKRLSGRAHTHKLALIPCGIKAGILRRG